MPYAVECYFDEASDRRIRQLWQALADSQHADYMVNSGHDPHFSLAMADDDHLNETRLCAAIKQFADQTAPFSINLATIGIFPGPECVLFLGLTVTDTLLRLHRHCHALIADCIPTPRSYYLPDHWVPHCTIGYQLSDKTLAGSVIVAHEHAGELLNRPVHIQSVGLIRLPAVQTLCCYPLVSPA
jgi:2'-5' RNA ligase